MTNHWIDIKNSDVILIMGSNAAENHPISFRWVTKARNAGAKLINVDPRFTRTSSKADIYAPMRSGADIALLGGMLNYLLQNDYIHDEYVSWYTNAGYVIKEGFDFDTATGVFSGYDPGAGKYDKSSWVFETDDDGIIVKDRTLQHERCVYQFLRSHYARYDLDAVSSITGTPKEKLQEVYETYVKGSYQPGTAGTIMYAMGWTQHTVGAQNIRAMSMIQLLLGNIGVAGGGVNALRGESNVQGSTDHCLLFHILPGYLKTPQAAQDTLGAYNTKWTPVSIEPRSANWWGNYPKYTASFLKSMYGPAATADNDFAYAWLPKRDDGVDYSWQPLFDAMYKGVVKGFFAWGQNPACSSANANKVRAALTKLDWLVTVNPFPTETSEFWRGPDMDPASIDTEVWALPAAASIEKEGSITNSGRWAQWRYKAVEPPGDAMPDSEIMDLLYTKVRALYAADASAAFPDPIVNLKWDYFGGAEKPARLLAKEINGYFIEDITIGDTSYEAGDLVPSFSKLQADGTTSSGNWLYCNSYVDHDFAAGNKMARRTRETEGIGLNLEWAWCWPVNRRIVYNRASVDLKGNPYDSARPVISWTADGWIGDVPDGGWPPLQNPDGSDNENAKLPFIMEPEGVGRIFGITKMVDGPVPEHYEPLESPLENNPMAHAQRINPAVYIPPAAEMSPVAAPGSAEFPIICSTYRVVEHWQTGVMTRWTPWLNELQPEMFCEMSEELANEKGITNGEAIKVKSARGELSAVAIVTKRFKPYTIMGNTVHQVGVPWCYGWVAPAMDNTHSCSANLLTPNVGDPNTRIPESKAFMVDVVKEG